MPTRSAYYDLERGFVHNWLVAGPQAMPVDLDRFQGDNFRQQVASYYYESQSGITQTPVERGPLTAGLFQVGDYAGSWEYYACREDHLVEKSDVYLTPQYLRSWAYTQLDCKAGQELALVFFTHGPADIWVNDQHVFRYEEFHGQQAGRVTVRVRLQKGVNKILARFEAVAVRECPYAIALQVCKPTEGSITRLRPCQVRDGIRVSIPTLIEAIARHKGPGGRVNVLTHCNAGWLATVDWGTATSAIYTAHERGIPIHVWVDETRPRSQGSLLTAWELASHGVPHTIVVDNAGGHLMQRGQVDLCITGTDRTTAAGDVANKIGTYLKALAAHDNGVPFYVALPSPTIDWSLGEGLRSIPIEERAATEVTHVVGLTAEGQALEVQVTAPGSPAANPAFDVTPARLVTGLVTERGVCEASRAGLKRLFPERAADAA